MAKCKLGLLIAFATEEHQCLRVQSRQTNTHPSQKVRRVKIEQIVS
jgi:hypothetical protein